MKDIKLMEDEIKHMEAFINRHKDAEFGWQKATSYLRKTIDDLWTELFEIYPECKSSRKSASFDFETHTISYEERP